MRNRAVIFICGVAGSGKSTLVSNIKNQMQDIETLSFDSYLNDSSCPPEYFEGKITDPKVIISQRFVEDLQDLKSGIAIIDPNGIRKEPRKIILVDENFGRLRASVAPLIDYQIYVDVPKMYYWLEGY